MQHKGGGRGLIPFDAHAWGALCGAQVFQGSTAWKTLPIYRLIFTP